MCCFHIYIYIFILVSPDILFLNFYFLFIFFVDNMCLELPMMLLSIGLNISFRMNVKGHLDIHIHSLFFQNFYINFIYSVDIWSYMIP